MVVHFHHKVLEVVVKNFLVKISWIGLKGVLMIQHFTYPAVGLIQQFSYPPHFVGHLGRVAVTIRASRRMMSMRLDLVRRRRRPQVAAAAAAAAADV